MLSLAPYLFDSIRINGREVLIQDIVKTASAPQSEFEASTFSFIRDWLTGKETFRQLTSGSTGDPKEITLSRDQMIASARMTEQALDLQAGWCALLCLNPSYIAGKMMLVRSFVTGMKVMAVEPSANPFLLLADDQPVDFSALVPSQIHDIVRSEKAGVLNRINTIIIGGAAMDSETREKLSEFSCRFYATYGMTETLSHIALMALNGKLASDYFTVLPGVAISRDKRGCLVIQSNHLPEKITTNDLVEIRDASSFRWVGRWDNVINSGGLKVIPEKLEKDIVKILIGLGIHQNFFVSSLPDQKLGNKIVLVIEHEVGPELLENIRTEIKGKMRPQEVPKEVYTTKRFVYTESGKIDRSATMKRITDNIDT
jgi:o-succinylbenzoate---CoA ligase